MAIEVKSAEQAAGKWQERASGASQLMVDGALAKADDWARNTANSADNYHMAITAGNIKQRFQNGVRKAGATKFAAGIQNKAGSRYSTGVQAAGTDYQAGVAPYLSTIASLNLSQRKPRGDPGNYTRVAEVGRALHNKRIAMLGASA